MKKKGTIFFSVVLGLLSAGFVVSATPDLSNACAYVQEASRPSSITGKIMSVDKNSFTLSVGSAINDESSQQTTQQTMKFDVDRNTAIDGKLQVGKTADVTYRQSNGGFVAISVRVAP